MTLTTLALFISSTTLLSLTPGPNMLMALSNGMTGSRRVALWGILGTDLGEIVLIAVAALGLSGLFAASATLFDAVRWIGVVYLCWLGFQLWRSEPRAASEELPVPDSEATLTPGTAFRRSLIVTLSNPKAILFYGAFLPQFIDLAEPAAPQYLLLGTIAIVIETLSLAIYAGAGAQAMRWLTRRSLKALNRVCAASMWLLAGALALYRKV